MAERKHDTAALPLRTPTGADHQKLDGVATLEDPVLSALSQTAVQYRAIRSFWEKDAAEVHRIREELEEARERHRLAAEEVSSLRTQLEHERGRAAKQQARANEISASLKDIHRALFSNGSVFEYLLKACMAITGAKRGLYITSWGAKQIRVRSAIGVEGYPEKAPSNFIRALCDRVAESDQTFICNDERSLAALPPPGPSEAVRNCMAAPVVLAKQFNGVVVLADRPGDGFTDEHADMVINVGDHASVAIENGRLRDDLMQAYFSIVGVLADAIEAKDSYTHGHCELVALYSRLTAARLKAPPEVRSVSCYGGLLHDIGKIGVSDGILNKPGKLMPEEWDLMRSHVRIGRDLLAHVPALDGVADVVLHHHERYDGAGYPEGLKTEEISLAARIVCVVDAYCAMIAKRSYKDSMSPEEARTELLHCKGTHFDPVVVDAFLEILSDPEVVDDCPDGCGLLPRLQAAGDFVHAIRSNYSPRPGAVKE